MNHYLELLGVDETTLERYEQAIRVRDSDESAEVRRVERSDIRALNIHPSIRPAH